MLTLISQAALFTMMYSDSLARFVFEGDENFSGSYLAGAGESGYKITLSLAVLAVPSMFSGFFFKDLFIGFGAFTFVDSILLLPTNAHFFESDYMFAIWRIAPVVSSFFTIFLVILGFDFLNNQIRPVFFKIFASIKYVLGGLITFIVDFFSLN
jgi:NADH:ubiquinone oxidoreductase subunit 5 (subunit L)/multisubunit Na+/H+ antiporter MnhA subunit